MSEDAAEEALHRSGADGVMIGRGCYGRPWFPAQVAHFLRTGARLPEPALARQKAILLEHYAAVLLHFGTDAGVRLARKHLAWYSRGLPGSAEFRATLNRLAEVPAVLRMIDAFYDPLIARGVARTLEGSLPDAALRRQREAQLRPRRALRRRPRRGAPARPCGAALGAAGAGGAARCHQPRPLRQPRRRAVPRPLAGAARAASC